MGVKIRNKKPRMLVLMTGDRLLPGKTGEISNEAYLQVRDDPTFLSWCKLGYVQVLQERVVRTASAGPAAPALDGAPPHPLAGKLALLKGPDAVKEVAKTEDMDLLLIWQRGEARKGVSAALTDRLLALQEAADAANDDGDGDGADADDAGGGEADSE